MARLLFLIIFSFIISCQENELKESMTLKEELQEKEDNFNSKASEDIKSLYEEGINDIKEKNIIENAKNIGEKAPDFTLLNQNNKTVTLSNYIDDGPVIITWYRGGWCPYCNITLKHLTNNIDKFKSHDARLIALTPELPDSSISTAEKHSLNFDVVSDTNNLIAKKYGIVFKLIDGVAKRYENSFGLSEYNGNENNELPLAATYVINREGEIVYSFLDADYKKRASISEILEILKKL